MNARYAVVCAVAVVLASAVLPRVVASAAEMAPAHREKLVWIDQSLQKVVTLYRDKKTDELQKLIGEIETAIGGLQVAAEGQENLDAILNPFRARLSAAQKLAAYVPPQMASAKPVAKPNMPKPGEAAGAGGVSFTKEIAPIIVGKCGNCHVRGNSGNFSMADYNALMAGTDGQFAVIKPGKGETSTLVEKLVGGEMPPGGNKCTDMEIATITKWINEGAKFDGPDATASLFDLTPGGNPNAPPTVARGSATDKIQFMRDVLPIFRDNCFNCHDAQRAQDASGRFSMYTFGSLLRGGQDGGKAINPGDPEGSFLVKMLHGTALGPDGKTKKPKMPRRGSLSDDQMATILNWIKDGAKFDGESQNESLDLLFRIEVAKKATHEELTASRLAEAKRRWARGNPDSTYEVIETNDFTILGDLGPVRMQEAAKQLEEDKTKIVSSLKLPSDKPLVKGKIVLFLYDKKFEYAEFGRVSEGRELPQQQLGHWFFNYIECYGAIVAQETPEMMGPLMTEVIVGAYLDSLGSVAPRWFAVGTARNVAGQLHSKSPMVKQWQDAIAPAMAAGLTAKAVLDTKNPDANTNAIAQAFVRELMKTPAWTTLMSAIARGSRFDPAFNQAYRTGPEPMLTGWLRSR
jgi:hypothetical protein